MNQKRIEELERLRAAGTQGPWFVSGVRFKMNGAEWHGIQRYNEAIKQDDNVCCVGYDPRTGEGRADAALIVAAVNALPEMIARVEEMERLRAERDRAQRACEQMGARITALEISLAEMSDCQPLPKIYKYTGTAEVDVENMFDVGHRHVSGKKPYDYLKSWLSMLRPFAYATQDDSWGELEKLISIVMNNYVQILVKAETARAALRKEP